MEYGDFGNSLMKGYGVFSNFLKLRKTNITGRKIEIFPDKKFDNYWNSLDQTILYFVNYETFDSKID